MQLCLFSNPITVMPRKGCMNFWVCKSRWWLSNIPRYTYTGMPQLTSQMLPCREVEVRCLADVAQALEQGNARRTVAAHNLNEFSSRSHAVLQVETASADQPNCQGLGDSFPPSELTSQCEENAMPRRLCCRGKLSCRIRQTYSDSKSAFWIWAALSWALHRYNRGDRELTNFKLRRHSERCQAYACRDLYHRLIAEIAANTGAEAEGYCSPGSWEAQIPPVKAQLGRLSRQATYLSQVYMACNTLSVTKVRIAQVVYNQPVALSFCQVQTGIACISWKGNSLKSALLSFGTCRQWESKGHRDSGAAIQWGRTD